VDKNKDRFLNYIGVQFHSDPNINLQMVDATTGEILDPEIKCGITVINSDSKDIGRVAELGRTKAPIGWLILKVYESNNRKQQLRAENAFKILCDNVRCKTNGLTEYYRLPVDTAVKFYEEMGLVDVSSELIDERDDDAGAKQVRKDSKGCKEMEDKWGPTGLFTNYGSSYASYNNVDSVSGLNNVSFHPNGKTVFINYYHGGKLDGNEEFQSRMRDLGKEKGLKPSFNKRGCRFNQESLEKGEEMFKVLKEQDFVPIENFVPIEDSDL